MRGTTRLSKLGVVLFALLCTLTPATAGELDVSIMAVYQTCVGEELGMRVRLENLNANFDIGSTRTWIDVEWQGSTVYEGEGNADVRDVNKSDEIEFDFSTGWIPDTDGSYVIKLFSEGEFAINGQQTDQTSTTICPAPSCPEKPTPTATIIYLGSGNSGSISYSAQPNCCYKIKFTIVTGRSAVTAHSPEDWVEFTGGSQDVSITVDRSKWGDKFIVGRLDYQDCDGNNRGSDYILVRDGEEQAAADPTPPSTPSTTGQTPQAGSDGDPVNTALREQTMPVSIVDAEQIGKMPVRNIREYISALPGVRSETGFGPGWTHSYAHTAVVTQHEAYVLQPNGRTIRFRNTGSDYELDWPKDAAYDINVTQEGTYFADPVEHRVYGFNTTGYLTSIHDGYGFKVDLTYDAGLLHQVLLPSGKGLTYSWTDDRITGLTNGEASVSYAYTNGYLTGFTDARGNTTQYEYDAGNRLARTVTPEGRTAFETTYDTDGNVTEQSIGTGFSVGFDRTNDVTTMTYPLGLTRTHTHDGDQRLIEATDADGNAATFDYDASGNRSSITDRDGESTDRTYTNGLLTQLDNPDGSIWKWAYSSRTYLGVTMFELSRIELPNGAAYTFETDDLGRNTRTTTPDGSEFTFDYDDAGSNTSISGPGINSTYLFNADGLQTSHRDIAGIETEYRYNTSGQVNVILRGNVEVGRFGYDANGNMTQATNPFTGTTQFTYDRDNRLTATTDAENRTWTRAYDNQGRVIRGENPSGGGVDLSWVGPFNLGISLGSGQNYQLTPDRNGRIGAIVNPTGATWNMDYTKEGVISGFTLPGDLAWTVDSDAMGRTTKITGPENRSWSYTYDQLGRRSSSTGPSGTAFTKIHSQDGTTLTTSYGDLEITRTMDPPTGSVRYRVLDDLIWTTTRDSDHSYTHSSPSGKERVVELNTDGLVASYDVGNNLKYFYSFSDHLPVKADYNGVSHEWTFDASGRVNSVDEEAVGRDETGRVSSYQGVSYDRTDNGDITRISLDATRWLQYSYDTRGFVTEIEDWQGGVTQLVYDGEGHLCDVTYPNGLQVTYEWSIGAISGVKYGDDLGITYERDDAGQITKVTRNLGFDPDYRTEDRSMSYNDDNQLEQGSYDELDNFKGTSTSPTVSYDGFGASEIDWGAVRATLASDAWGYPTEYARDDFRVGIKWSLGAGIRLPLEVTTNDETTTMVGIPQLGILLYGINANGARRYLLDDGLGNTVLEMNEDNEVVGGRLYDPFGATIGRVGTPWYFGYQGTFGAFTYQDGDSDDDVVSIGDRTYFPRYGRFGTAAGAFSGMPASDDPRRANRSTLSIPHLRFAIGGDEDIDLNERFRSACNMQAEDFVHPNIIAEFGYRDAPTDPRPSGDGGNLDERFRIGVDYRLQGGLSAGFNLGYEYLNDDPATETEPKPSVTYISPTIAGFSLGVRQYDPEPSQEFSTTTKLHGDNSVFTGLRPRLRFGTSFTGSDHLRVRLDYGDQDPIITEDGLIDLRLDHEFYDLRWGQWKPTVKDKPKPESDKETPNRK